MYIRKKVKTIFNWMAIAAFGTMLNFNKKKKNTDLHLNNCTPKRGW